MCKQENKECIRIVGYNVNNLYNYILSNKLFSLHLQLQIQLNLYHLTDAAKFIDIRYLV